MNLISWCLSLHYLHIVIFIVLNELVFCQEAERGEYASELACITTEQSNLKKRYIGKCHHSKTVVGRSKIK